MMCADVPNAPSSPTVIIQNLDQIVIEWEPPASDGGTPILGYQVDMKKDGDPSYIQIYDGAENPGARLLEVTEYNSAPLEVTTYYFRVRALNWIGASASSSPDLTIILLTQTSAPDSVVSGDRIGTIKAYVPAEVNVLAKDASGNARTTGGDIFSLQVNNE